MGESVWRCLLLCVFVGVCVCESMEVLYVCVLECVCVWGGVECVCVSEWGPGGGMRVGGVGVARWVGCPALVLR